MDQLSRVNAVFKPKRIDNLKPRATEFIGISGSFLAAYRIEGGEYNGQMAMLTPVGWPFAWCPEVDLEM